MTVPLINGTSCINFYAKDQQLHDEAIDFYTNTLGLKLHGSYLINDLNAVTINITLDPRGYSHEEVTSKKNSIHHLSHDWRSLESTIVFKVPDLSFLIKSLASAHIQISPNKLYPNEVYIIDPLGYIIGFTQLSNILSSNPPIQKVVEDIITPESAIITHKRNIAVMTSGGDAPGMNACVRAVVRASIYRGCKSFAILEGYEGLVNGGDKYIKEMKWHDVSGFLAEGGTLIGTARNKEFRERPGRLKSCKNLIDAGIDALIICGGDGSLTGADLFRQEWPSLLDELLQKNQITQDQKKKYQHLNICGLVGSIDNDMATTDATIGAYSSLDRICHAIDYIDATANSHSRAFVVEVMGRHCGWLALMAGMATAADYILIPEKPSSSKGWQDQMCEIVGKHRARGKRKTIVIVAEGAITLDLDPISADDVKNVLVDRLGLDTRVTTLGHVQRGGSAVAYDRSLATFQGVEAVKAVLESTPDTPSPLIAIEENEVVRKSLVEAVEKTKSVAEAIENKQFDEAMKLREPEFNEHLNNFMDINSADHNNPTLPVEKRKKIAIINVGAPAGGMNSAVYAMACYCMSKGHIPYAIHNGFGGLARHESIRSIDWLQIDGYMSLGGSEIGTNRQTPAETDIGMIAYYFEKYQFDGLILVGGFEAFISLEQLENSRVMYPAFRIPMVLIPATISNNVPGTEYSLGADTCLNALMTYCDVVKQSASATRDRAFIIEVQGGNSGYIATFAQLIAGAQLSYVPEEGIELNQLDLDINSLKESFSVAKDFDRSGKLIIKSTNSSEVLTTDVLAAIIKQESNGEFDVKTAKPGHVQQGGLPSPIDRTRAARLAVKAVQFIENKCDLFKDYRFSLDYPYEDVELQNTAAVLGALQNKIQFNSIKKLYTFETELKKRMPKKIHWAKSRDIADQLVGRSRIPPVKA